MHYAGDTYGPRRSTRSRDPHGGHEHAVIRDANENYPDAGWCRETNTTRRTTLSA